ncbi:MAG: VOC family protein [Acidimicrobiales bacterium]
MPTPVAAQAMSEAGLVDWRYLLGGIEASFEADASGDTGAFTEAASFAAAVAKAADDADHHPDIDLRYPGVVHVTLTTHSIDGLSDLDLDLASTISSLAAAMGMRSLPATTERLEIAIDALDIDAIRPFWMAVLGYRRAGNALVDPQRRGPAVWFQQMDSPRQQRNRIHIDVSVAHDEAEARVAAALAAGGVMVSDARARAFWVLADAEGNEVCVCTWQDRD